MFPIYRIETLLFSREKREILFSIEIIERLVSSTEKGVAVAVAMLVAECLWPNACGRGCGDGCGYGSGTTATAITTAIATAIAIATANAAAILSPIKNRETSSLYVEESLSSSIKRINRLLLCREKIVCVSHI